MFSFFFSEFQLPSTLENNHESKDPELFAQKYEANSTENVIRATPLVSSVC